jgi:hypothetical protein
MNVIHPDPGESRLDALQRHAFGYFLNETNPANGLVADRTQPGAPASITAVGFALAVYPVGVERAWMTRTDAVARTLALLRFFWTSPQGTTPEMTGHKGFYYHFLDMTTGARAARCELSTIDTAFLLAAALYFDQDSEAEREVRTLADALYRRAARAAHAVRRGTRTATPRRGRPLGRRGHGQPGGVRRRRGARATQRRVALWSVAADERRRPDRGAPMYADRALARDGRTIDRRGRSRRAHRHLR